MKFKVTRRIKYIAKNCFYNSKASVIRKIAESVLEQDTWVSDKQHIALYRDYSTRKLLAIEGGDYSGFPKEKPPEVLEEPKPRFVDFAEAMQAVQAGKYVERESWCGLSYLSLTQNGKVVATCRPSGKPSDYTTYSRDLAAVDWKISELIVPKSKSRTNLTFPEALESFLEWRVVFRAAWDGSYVLSANDKTLLKRHQETVRYWPLELGYRQIAFELALSKVQGGIEFPLTSEDWLAHDWVVDAAPLMRRTIKRRGATSYHEAKKAVEAGKTVARAGWVKGERLVKLGENFFQKLPFDFNCYMTLDKEDEEAIDWVVVK